MTSERAKSFNLLSFAGNSSNHGRARRPCGFNTMNSEDTPTARVAAQLRGSPAGVWALGFISLLLDV
jgi:hypothetical protein